MIIDKNLIKFSIFAEDSIRSALKKIEENIRVFIEDDNEYLGAFMCQGKMPIQVREKYNRMRNGDNGRQVDAMIRNFDMAMLHPDMDDLEHAREFVGRIYETLEKDGI